MQRKSLLWLTLFPLFLLQGCGGGAVNLKSTDGSQISFKKENVVCIPDVNDEWYNGYRDNNDYPTGYVFSVECTSNGVRTDLAENKSVFSQKVKCYDHDVASGLINETTILCKSAKEFGLLSDYEED